MRATYYPGCSLQGTARDYADSIRWVCENLGIALDEIPDWNCCGATAAHSIHHSAAVALSARNLNLAAKMPYRDVLVPCPMCFNRLMTARSALEVSSGEQNRTEPKRPSPRIWDLSNFFASKPVLERVGRRVERPLNGLKVVCYYGCMASRPPDVTRATDFENPKSMDRIIDRLGATAIDWPFKTDCCGATQALTRRDMVLTLIKPLFEMAGQVGAQAFVVSCQMCQANLDMFQGQVGREMGQTLSMPVYYFTELIGLAIGDDRIKNGLARHITDPVSLLNEIGYFEGKGEAVA